MIWQRGFFWNILLLGLCGLLLLGIVHVWWGEELPTEKSRSGKGLGVPAVPLLRDDQPLSAYNVVASKNLFSQDRRGPEPGAPAPKVQATLEGRRLLGTIIVGTDRAALISQAPPRGQVGKTAQIEVVHQGEEWGGFTVLEISSESVVFQNKDGKKTLTFPE